MPTEEESPYQGGSGGKIQKNHNRTDSNKPYDRPAEAVRKSWIPKFVVDPAQKLFAFALRKNLPALTTIPEANHESTDAFPEEVLYSPGDQEQVRQGMDNLNNNSGGGTIDDLEQILKQKTFTKAEFDHLTELLQSRTSDVSAEDEKRTFKTSTSQLVEAPCRKGSLPVQENEVKNQTLLGIASDPLSSSSFFGEDVVSPSELAKRYMESRHSKTPSLTLNSRNQAFREDVSLRTSLPFTPKSHSMSLTRRRVVPYASVPRGPENGFLTPMSMARPSYAGVHHTAMLKGVGPMTEEKISPSTSSHRSWENHILSGGKQASKRRSSVLDGDMGSIGPIRRVRRKTNMMYSSERTGLSIPTVSLSTPFNLVGSKAAKGPTSSIQKQFQLDEHKHHTSARATMENGDGSIAGKRFVCVPNKSQETAQKILQQLDKFVSPPKGKSCELQTTTVLGTSPFNATPELLHGQARKSLEDVDLSKSPHNAYGNGNFADLGDNHGARARDLTSQKKVRVHENGSTMVSISKDKLVPEANGVVIAKSSKDARSSFKTANGIISCSNSNDPQKKQACGKNANKDPPELAENNFGSRFESNTLVAGKGKHDKPTVKSKEIADEAAAAGGPPGSLSDLSTPGSFVLKNSCATGTSDNHPASAKHIGLAYPVSVATSTGSKPAPSTSLPPSSFRTSSSNEPTCIKASFASRIYGKDPPFTFSSASIDCEISGMNGIRPEAKLETVSSVAMSSKGTTASSLNVNPASTTVGPAFQFGSSASTTGSAPSTFGSSLGTPSFTSASVIQPPSVPQQSNFTFGAPPSSGGPAMFQFKSQDDPTTSHNQSPGSLGFSGGEKFALSPEGGDKSKRRFIKARRLRKS